MFRLVLDTPIPCTRKVSARQMYKSARDDLESSPQTLNLYLGSNFTSGPQCENIFLRVSLNFSEEITAF